MADKILPVLLNQGLDHVTPPLLAKEGSLVACLNYEMTGDIGYKRIDGFERYDGYPNGAVSQYYTATINANTAGQQGSIGVGTVITRPIPMRAGVTVVGEPPANDIGMIVSVNGGNNYSYIPYDDSGVLKNGDAVTLRSSTGTTILSTVASSSTDGKVSAGTAGTYLANLRSYATTLRNLVQDAPGPIAGCWWLRRNLYLAVNAPVLRFIYIDKLNPGFYPGSLIRFQGIIYRMLTYVEFDAGTSPSPGEVRIAMMPVGTSATNDSTVVEVTAADVAVQTRANTGTLTQDSEWAYVVRCETPGTSTKRGYTALTPSFRIPFDAGTYTTENLPTGAGWTLRTADGSRTINAELINVQSTSGTFVGNNAAGWAVFGNFSGETGGSSISDDWQAWYGGVRRLTVNAPFNDSIMGPRLAGTMRLLAADTRYQTTAANFYGNYRTTTTYGATGASRGFWASYSAFGSLYTQESEALDQPKYVAYHLGRLSLGYEVGSVIQSKAGDPMNFNGTQGAREIATGDKLTGLVEAPGETLVVFGRNTIRQLQADGIPRTISSTSGAYDYTAVPSGQDIMYTGSNGVSTLQQSAAYGDFEGVRASAPIQPWLRPRLLVELASLESGGIAMALPVRNKNQYRLFLKSGEVVIITSTTEGFKSTFANYGVGTELRVPFAWSSDVDDYGGEQIHVVWDYELAAKGLRGVVGTLPEKDRVYQMDAGWGFDGVTFQHYFDTAHVFINAGGNNGGIERVRLHGQSYGIATLDLKVAGIEDDYDQPYPDRIQDISMPATPVMLRTELGHFTGIVDHANWGLGLKVRIQGSTAAGTTNTEPSHICQVLVLHVRTEGALDG